MVSAQRHRGPDEFGLYRDPHVGLGHARLSIVDIASGQQPLTNEDNNYWVVFNGEIFNYIELHAELEAAGHRFKTRSDTEVIVHAFEQWGDEAFERFNGQWAIALWDRRRRILTLSRDRVGVRPLHYAEHDGRLYFASEVKGIFAGDGSIPRRFDPRGLEETLTFWTVVPPQGIFAGVSEVRPGHVRTIQLRTGAAAEVTERAYWTPNFAADPFSPLSQGASTLASFGGTLDDAVGAVRSALEQATALRMLRADVPVGSYLSGGLDSSLVASLALAAKGDRFHTFSLRFEDAEYDRDGISA
jgi:asparagine synthase (glutamine-hydrolysing)